MDKLLRKCLIGKIIFEVVEQCWSRFVRECLQISRNIGECSLEDVHSELDKTVHQCITKDTYHSRITKLLCVNSLTEAIL